MCAGFCCIYFDGKIILDLTRVSSSWLYLLVNTTTFACFFLSGIWRCSRCILDSIPRIQPFLQGLTVLLSEKGYLENKTCYYILLTKSSVRMSCDYGSTYSENYIAYSEVKCAHQMLKPRRIHFIKEINS